MGNSTVPKFEGLSFEEHDTLARLLRDTLAEGWPARAPCEGVGTALLPWSDRRILADLLHALTAPAKAVRP